MGYSVGTHKGMAMKVNWEDVKADYARKDARIKDLELKLLKALGMRQFLCGDIENDVSIYEDKSWFYAIGPSDQKAIPDAMESLGITGTPEDYSCAADLLSDFTSKIY